MFSTAARVSWLPIAMLEGLVYSLPNSSVFLLTLSSPQLSQLLAKSFRLEYFSLSENSYVAQGTESN